MNRPERRDESEPQGRAERLARSRAAHPSGQAAGQADRALATVPPATLGAAEHLEHRAVAWLARHRDHLDPDLAEESTRLFALKALVETSLLVGLRARLDPRPLDGPYAQLLEVIAGVAGRATYRELVNRDRRALLLYAGTYAALRLCGREDAAFRHVIERTVEGRFATSFERVPYRQLDLVHTLELAGIDLPGPGLEQTLPLSLLVADPNALELSNGDVYAITHAIFYASDFGQREIAWPSGVSTASVVALVEECLLLARAREDADLVGELLICLTCLRTPASPLATSARDWLRGWQESDGRVEGPPGVVPQRLLDADPAWGGWATAYHTTIVVALENLLLRTVAPVIPEQAGPAEAGREAAKAETPLDGLLAAATGDPGAGPLPERRLAQAAGEPGAGAALADGRLAGAIRAAATWLDTAVPATHVRARLWSAEAWLAVGDEEQARAQLAQLAADPSIAFTALRDSADVAVHLAALVVGLGLDCRPLEDLLDDVAALLAGSDPWDTQLDAARARIAGARGQVWRPGAASDVPMPQNPADLRAATQLLCADLLSRGPSPLLTPDAAERALLLLTRCARAAVEAFDVGWLAMVLRGLHRLTGTPPRLVRDVTDFLIGAQALDGSIGATALETGSQREELLAAWTLLGLAALVEAGPQGSRATG